MAGLPLVRARKPAVDEYDEDDPWKISPTSLSALEYGKASDDKWPDRGIYPNTASSPENFWQPLAEPGAADGAGSPGFYANTATPEHFWPPLFGDPGVPPPGMVPGYINPETGHCYEMYQWTPCMGYFNPDGNMNAQQGRGGGKGGKRPGGRGGRGAGGGEKKGPGAPSAASSKDCDTADIPEDGTETTVMLRNIPNGYTRDMLLELLDSLEFHALYDFVYLPMDFRNGVNLGYAFVNLIDHETAQKLWGTLTDFKDWKHVQSEKACQLDWARPHQGKEKHVDRYKNSPVMHADMPDKYKPIVFVNGKEVPFPEPTKAPRAPKQRPKGPERGSGAVP